MFTNICDIFIRNLSESFRAAGRIKFKVTIVALLLLAALVFSGSQYQFEDQFPEMFLEIINEEYDSEGRLIRKTEIRKIYVGREPVEITYEYEYDSEDRIIKETENFPGTIIGTTREYQYDSEDRIIKETETYPDYSNYDGEEKYTVVIHDEHEYDSKGRLIKKNVTYPDDTGPIIVVQEYEYNSEDKLRKEIQTAPDGSAIIDEREYDSESRITKIILTSHPDGDVLSMNEYEYNSEGNLIEQRRTYDNDDVDIFKLNSEGTLIELIMNSNTGHVTTLEYDSEGNLERSIFASPDGLFLETKEYDLDRNLKESIIINPDGRVTTQEYVRGQIKESVTVYPDGRVDTKEYAKGQLLKLTEINGDTTITHEYGYDSEGNRTNEIETHFDDDGITIYDYQYGSENNLEEETITFPDGRVDTKEYDENGILRQYDIKYTYGNVIGKQFSSEQQITQTVKYPDGIVSTYDFESKTKTTVTPYSVTTREFEYDDDGNIITNPNQSDYADITIKYRLLELSYTESYD